VTPGCYGLPKAVTIFFVDCGNETRVSATKKLAVRMLDITGSMQFASTKASRMIVASKTVAG
jgi:hypothetical protein